MKTIFTPRLDALRRQSHWLALAASACIVLAVVGLTLVLRPGMSAGGLAEGMGGGPIALLVGDYQSPQLCRGCHEAEFQDWVHTTHAQATFDPIFQTYLQQVEEPGECFACHSTGYNATTGQFVLAGVTCEACHGPYRPGHPQESAMAIARSADLCAACHTRTASEWQISEHGRAGVICVDCHEVHTQRTRAAARTNELCATCHASHAQSEVHQIHDAANVPCVDCHVARPANDGLGAMNGHAITGHSFIVLANTCDNCHPLRH